MKVISKEIFGAEIQYFRTDPQYWPTLIQRLKDTGLRCLTTYVQWGTHLVAAPDKKHPAGILDFEGRTNPRLNLYKFLDLVQESGLDMNFRCGPFCCNEMIHGGYPSWLVMGDPNTMVWDYQNRTTQGYWVGKKEGSQPSYLHPEYLAWCRKWLAVVDPIIKPRLKSKGGFITMLNLDNEISYAVKDSFLDSDYNPINVRPGGFYHQFLREKYGSVKSLPYGRKYASLEAVEPPRSVPETIGADLAWYVDWVEFKTWCMCRYIRELRSMHEANGVKDVTFMTNFNPHLPEGVPTRMPDFEKAVGPGGLVGYDFYRGVFMSYSGYHSMARVLKLMNATLKYTWSAEFMSGTWNVNLGNTRVSDDHMRFMARCALAQGCKSIDWFMFHDRDCWGDSPVSTHGHVRPSHQVLKETPDLLFNKIKDWDGLVPQMDTAIIYDLVQHQHTAIGDPSPCNDNDLHVGKPMVEGTPAGRASQEYLGLFRLVEENGMQAAVVDTVHSAKALTKYPLVFLPGSPLIGAVTNKALLNYVRGGGTLVVTGPWATRDGRGRAVKFMGLSAPGRKTELRKRIGKGTLIWQSAYVAQDKAEEESQQSIAMVGGLLKQHVMRAHVQIQPAELVKWVDWQAGGGHCEYVGERNLGSAVLHQGKAEQVLFVLNHYVTASRFTLTFKDIRSGELRDLDSDDVIPIRNGKCVVDVDRKSAAVYLVE
ncbi:MAG: alpha-amylase family protein [bacterium]